MCSWNNNNNNNNATGTPAKIHLLLIKGNKYETTWMSYMTTVLFGEMSGILGIVKQKWPIYWICMFKPGLCNMFVFFLSGKIDTIRKCVSTQSGKHRKMCFSECDTLWISPKMTFLNGKSFDVLSCIMYIIGNHDGLSGHSSLYNSN